MGKIIKEAITFDDVLLVPGYSEVIPNEVNLETKLTNKIKLNIPFMSASCKVCLILYHTIRMPYYVPDDAVEKILSFWEKYGSDKYAGIIGLDATFDNQVIGKEFPKDLKTTTLLGYYANGGVGDKKLVYRTDLMKKYPPYPEFEGEKYVGLSYKCMLCDQEYELLVLNEILCNVEYQLDGSSTNMFPIFAESKRICIFSESSDAVSTKTKEAIYRVCTLCFK